MIAENLARKFRPAGFEQPEGSRQNYTKPRPELQEAFDRWIDELPKCLNDENESQIQYEKACGLIKPLGEILYREANSLLVDFKPKTKIQKEAGLFISACYNQSPENIIIFDADVPEIWCIGHRLGKDKILVNNKKVGNCFGAWSSGVIVNNGEAGGSFGAWSSGVIVNNSVAGDWFGSCSSGTLIALQEPENYGREQEDRTLKPADCERIPELKQYLDELGDLTRAIKDEESAKRFLERYDSEPRKRIQQDIDRIFKKRGV